MRLAVVGLAAYVSAFWVVTLHLAISFCLPQGEVILSIPEIVQYFTVTLQRPQEMPDTKPGPLPLEYSQ